MKTFVIFLCCIALTIGMSIPALGVAVQPEISQSTTTIKYLGDGITLETTTTVYESLLRASSKRATKTSTYKDNGATIATVTLDATFGYDGSTAWVISASASNSISDSSWSYGSEKITTSGSTASVTGVLTKKSGIIVITTADVSISLTCSKDGTIT